MKYQPLCSAIAASFFAFLWAAPANAECQWRSSGLKSYLKCSDTVGQVEMDRVDAAPPGAGTLEVELSDTEHTERVDPEEQVVRDGRKAGAIIDRTAMDTGHDIDNAALGLRRELDRTGTDVGDLLKWATSTDMSCEDPSGYPASLALAYRGACSVPLTRFKQDANICITAAGGAAVTASTAESAAMFGASLALAKTASGLCEQACMQKNAFERCIAGVYVGVSQMQMNAREKSEKAEVAEAQSASLQCSLSSINQEMYWRFGLHYQQCLASPDCHPADPVGQEWILERNNAVLAEVTRRKDAIQQALDGVRDAGPPEYGPHVLQPEAAEIALTSSVVDRVPQDRICHTAAPKVTFWTKIMGREGQVVRHQWLYAGANDEETKLVFSKAYRVGSSEWRAWTTKLLEPGKWIVALVGPDDEILAQQVFFTSPVTFLPGEG